jgi:phosphatidylserine decarboxylase
MIAWISTNLVWTQASGIALILCLLCIIALLFWRPLLLFVIPAALFTLYFFRNPQRVCPEALHDFKIIVSPADGRIVHVDYDEQNRFDGYAWKIAIFLSPLDVHVNWVPTAGIIQRIMYRPGAFVPAFVPKSSEMNERADLHIKTDAGYTYIVRQIAGAVARRIVCWAHEGDSIAYGATYGMIRFGSRVELLLPSNVAIDVGIGQRVYGGQTIIGRWQ